MQAHFPVIVNFHFRIQQDVYNCKTAHKHCGDQSVIGYTGGSGTVWISYVRYHKQKKTTNCWNSPMIAAGSQICVSVASKVSVMSMQKMYHVCMCSEYNYQYNPLTLHTCITRRVLPTAWIISMCGRPKSRCVFTVRTHTSEQTTALVSSMYY